MLLDYCVYRLFISLDFSGLLSHRKTFCFRLPMLALLTKMYNQKLENTRTTVYQVESLTEIRDFLNKYTCTTVSSFRYMNALNIEIRLIGFKEKTSLIKF